MTVHGISSERLRGGLAQLRKTFTLLLDALRLNVVQDGRRLQRGAEKAVAHIWLLLLPLLLLLLLLLRLAKQT